MAKTSYNIQSSIIPLIAFVLTISRNGREQALRRYTKYYMKTKKRNRFQQFFFQVHLRLERACSYIEQELNETRGMRNDLLNR